MSQSVKYRPTYWIDGMGINKDHFINDNNANIYHQSLCMGSMINIYNYGLLPDTGNGNAELIVFVDNQQQVQVRLHKFRAITLSGHVIDIDGTEDVHNDHLKAVIPGLSVPFTDLKGKSEAYLIVLVIHPYERVPYGDADPDEIPLRYPYAVPRCTLHLMPVYEAGRNVVGAFHLPVGKLKIEEQRVIGDEAYVPPCCNSSSHENLLQLHAAIEKFLGKMQLYALQIIQKNLQRKQGEMAPVIKIMCEQVSLFTALHISSFKHLKLYQPPVYLIDVICSFASLLKNTFDMHTGSGKEAFINYCTEVWGNVSQGQLEGTLTSLANHLYNHIDIQDSIIKVSHFTEMFTQLFKKLADLEYIGKHTGGPLILATPVANSVVLNPIIATDHEIQPKKRSRFLLD